MQLQNFYRKHGTFSVILYNKKNKSMNGYFVQFSLINM